VISPARDAGINSQKWTGVQNFIVNLLSVSRGLLTQVPGKIWFFYRDRGKIRFISFYSTMNESHRQYF